jgi:glycosyltransferase involved in cell wall biosynthesis
LSEQLFLHIAPTPFFSNRGCHIRIRNELEALQAEGRRVIVCTYHHGNDVPEIDIRRIPAIPGYTRTAVGFSPFKFLADLLLFWLVLKVAVSERPCLLHGHLHEGALIGRAVSLVLFWRQLPVVMDMQGSLSGELEAYGTFEAGSPVLALFGWVEGIVCRLPDYFLCSSIASVDCLKERFGVSEGKIALLTDVVPGAFFAPVDKASARRSLMLPGERTIVIYTGSMLQGKGVEHALEAARRLAGTMTDPPYFVFVGYPSETAMAFVDRHRLNRHCRVEGEVAYDRLPLWLGAADAALEPKAAGGGEASGKLLHYMAAALPVAGFDTPANRDLLGKPGYWALGGETAAAALTASLSQLLEDPDDAMSRGREGRRKAARHHSPSAAAGVMLDTYAYLVK